MNIPLIIGDSHGNQLAKSFGKHVGAWEDEVDRPLEVVHEGQVTAHFFLLTSKTHLFVSPDGGRSILINPNYLAAINKASAGCASVTVAIEGNVHNWNFITEWIPHFDFFDPELPERLQAGVQIIPASVIDDFFNAYVPSIIARLELLKGVLAHLPHYFILPPPPIPSGAHIKKSWDEYTKKDSVIADKWLRLKIYKAYVRALKKCCDYAGFMAITPPGDKVDEDGFLREEYWMDATHATPGYYEDIIPA